MATELPRRRANYVPAPAFFNLNQACAVLCEAFPKKGNTGCYLVGSSIVRRDFRDVDVRLMLDDAEYDRMFRVDGGYMDALWSLMCTSISLWLSQQTGLPIDFQIQRTSDANRDNPKGPNQQGERQVLGLFRGYPGDYPSLGKDGDA